METKAVNLKAPVNNMQQDLINRCKTNDQKAQFRVYKLYYKAMYNTSLRIVNDTMEAEDIMQESFLAAFEKINTYSGTVSFGAWLKKIVINRSLDALRKKKTIFEDIENHIGIVDTGIEETANMEDINVKVEKVKQSIENLPDGERIIISLYLLEGYDHEEISDILSISCSTSRSQLSRAKNRLIKELKEAC
jgi:RNA polymerase sigma-70 factor (ECF subfamily)